MPGGPSMMTPRGISAPSAEYLEGFLRNSTTSLSSNLEPSHPATSSKVTPVSGSIWILDLDLPMSKVHPPPPPPPPPIPPERRCRKIKPPMMSRGKARLARTPATAPERTPALAAHGEDDAMLGERLQELVGVLRQDETFVAVAVLVDRENLLAVRREGDLLHLILLHGLQERRVGPRRGLWLGGDNGARAHKRGRPHGREPCRDVSGREPRRDVRIHVGGHRRTEKRGESHGRTRLIAAKCPDDEDLFRTQVCVLKRKRTRLAHGPPPRTDPPTAHRRATTNCTKRLCVSVCTSCTSSAPLHHKLCGGASALFGVKTYLRPSYTSRCLHETPRVGGGSRPHTLPNCKQ